MRERFWAHVLPRITGTTSSHQRVKPNDMLTAPIPALDRDARARWLETGDVLLRHGHRLHAESQHLARVRDALLQRIVTGQLRVPTSLQLDDIDDLLDDDDLAA